MSRTSKSPRTVLLIALDVARQALPKYAHRCSPKKYTQHQLFACLVLKTFYRTDYRGVVAMLAEWSDLRATIGLDDVPHFTTLQKTAARLLRRRKANRLLKTTLQRAFDHIRSPGLIKLAAIDGSGFESHHISRYFVRRRERGFNTRRIWQTMTYRRYPKIGLVCDCATHLLIAAQPGRGPGADIIHLNRVIVDALRRRRIHTLLADAGYDAEWAHEFLRNDLGIRSIIPAGIGRPTARAPCGRYRRQMKRRFPKKTYGQRWQVETVFSMIKRRLGATLSARTRWSQDRALMLKVIVHDLMIICDAPRCFLQSTPVPLSLRQFSLTWRWMMLRTHVRKQFTRWGTGSQRDTSPMAAKFTTVAIFQQPTSWLTSSDTEAARADYQHRRVKADSTAPDTNGMKIEHFR